MTGPDRHDRQRLMPGWDQARIAGATAVVAGVGALGNEVAKNLGLLGIGRLILCDPDTVAAHNLSRTVLFDDGDLDRPKAEAAARTLARMAPGTVVETRVDDLVRGVGIGELADADVVLGCLDTRWARLQLLERCTMAGTPLVDGGTHPWGGEVRLRVDPAEPCYGCTLTAAERWGSDVPASCAELGDRPLPASILSSSLVAGWMAATAAREVLGVPVPWRFLSVDIATGDTAPVLVDLDPECPHHTAVGAPARATVSRDDTVGELLAALPPGSEPLAWAEFPPPQECYSCHRVCEPGYGYREPTIACPHCGDWLRLARTTRVREASAGTKLAELGIAPHEVLAVRSPDGEYSWLRLG
ncbi:HesA/MoeB/ThiF family protein [Actinoplanes sp. CA-142083]|uniref:HesA/MoeB/ThiF family protein n=1 Tax=Actinoplanes sp. CA-142083 TaxID=3239903 RepID=UPI003D8E028B